MTFSLAAKVSRNTKSALDLAGGSLQILTASDVVLVSVPLAAVTAGIVASESGILTFSGLPVTVTGQADGIAAKAQWMTSAGAVYKTVTSDVGSAAIGILGAEAKIIIDNSNGDLLITTGDEIEVFAMSWIP